MDWEAGANAKVTLTPNTSLTSDFIFSSKESVATDVAVELADKSGLVESLDMSLKWGCSTSPAATKMIRCLHNRLTTCRTCSYRASWTTVSKRWAAQLTPGTTVTVNQLDGGDATVGLEVRAVLTEAIPATTFGLKWKTGSSSIPATRQGRVGYRYPLDQDRLLGFRNSR